MIYEEFKGNYSGIVLVNDGVLIPFNSSFWVLEPIKFREGLFDALAHYKFIEQLRVYDMIGPRLAVKEDSFDNFEDNPYFSDKDKEQLMEYQNEIVPEKIKRTASGNLRGRIIERDLRKCRYCGKSLSGETVFIDHVIPYSLGGLTEENNLVCACFKCNSKKAGNLLKDIDMDLLEIEK